MLISIYQSVGPCVSCVIVFVCDFNPEHQPKPYHPSQSFSKFDAFLHKLHKAHTKLLLVLRCQDSLGKQINTLDHTFSRRNKATKKSRVWRLDKVWKRGVGGIFAEKIGLDTFCRQWFWLKVQVSVLLLDRFCFVLCLSKISRILRISTKLWFCHLQITIQTFTLQHGCSVNLLHIFRTLFHKNTSGWLRLKVLK